MAPADDPVEEARAEYTRGVAHAQAGEWAEAEAAFRRALELHPNPAIRVNLASALVEQGRYREAHGELFTAESDPELPPSLQDPIARLRERIRSEAGRLAISRSGDSVGAEVVLDEDPVEESWLASDIPVSPGAHVVIAQRDGSELARAEVEVGAAERTQVVLGLTERVIGGEGGEPDDTPLFIGIGVGAGAVAVVAIVIIAAVAASSGGGQPIAGNFNPGLISWP